MILDFKSLTVAETKIVASKKSDRQKLSRLGNIYYECAEGLELRSRDLLDLATKPDNDGDTQSDETFGQHLESWMRTSISGNFLDVYLQPRPRKLYERSSVEIVEISQLQAVADFAIDEVAEDIAAEVQRIRTEIAHEENIELWAKSLRETMNLWGADIYTFRQLAALSSLSPSCVFLAVFLGDCFILSSDCQDFYGGFCVSCLF